jgi:glucosylceramidase
MKVITSSASGLRWQESQSIPFNKQTALPIEVDRHTTYQTHLGFGGSLTEAAAYTIKEQHDDPTINKMIDLYFSDTGLAYNWTRIHMNSSDFALGNYTYVNHGDKNLSSFSIDRETWYVLPILHKVLAIKPELNILISPWSPPGWMKDNQQMNHGGKLLPAFYQVWAKYYVKFIQALKIQGIQPWGVTVQNEPAAKQVWDSCLYSPEEERDFVKFHLGPAIRQAFSDTIKIVVWDHNRDIIVDRVTPIYQDPLASQFVWGTGFHWYGEEKFENLGKVKALFPDKHLLFTEGCIEGGPQPGVWATGERYARNIIGDFNQGNEGFIDWNLVLNEQGGPNHVGNYCDAPILFDRRNQTIIKNSSYYVIGHFSKFIVPGSVRVALKQPLPIGLLAVAYLRPDQKLVLVVLNTSQEDKDFRVKLTKDDGMVHSPAKSIITVIQS